MATPTEMITITAIHETGGEPLTITRSASDVAFTKRLLVECGYTVLTERAT